MRITITSKGMEYKLDGFYVGHERMHKLTFYDEHSKTIVGVRIPDSVFDELIYSLPRGRLFEAFGMDYDEWIEDGHPEWEYRHEKIMEGIKKDES